MPPPPTKVLSTHPCGREISQSTKKEKMQIAPACLLKTKGQKKCSCLIYENKGVICFSGLLYDTKGVRSIFALGSHADGHDGRNSGSSDQAVCLGRRGSRLPKGHDGLRR